MYHRLFSLVFCLLLAGCAPTTVKTLTDTPGTRTLSSQDILVLVESNTLFIHSLEEDTYLYFAPDGRLFGQDIFANKDTGRWDVSEDAELCLQMGKWWYGDLKCYHVYTTADKKIYLANASDVLEYSSEAFSGDSKSLYTVPPPKRKSYRKSTRKQSSSNSKMVVSNQENTTAIGDSTNAGTTLPDPTYSKQDIHQTIHTIARDCEGCNFSGADFKKANLIEAKLANADLSGANLTMANLRRANLSGANLSGANLKFANMPGANLRNANLRDADLRGANLIKADLTGAELDGTIFSEALLEGVKGMR